MRLVSAERRDASIFLGSSTLEYVSIELLKVLLVLQLATTNNAFLVLLVPTAALIGPVVLGPVAGMVLDRVPLGFFWLVALVIAIVVPFFGYMILSNESRFLISGMTAVSVIAYLSAVSRIVASKYIISEKDMTFFHGSLIWVLQLIPIAGPLLAGFLNASSAKGPWFIVWIILLVLGAFVVRSLLNDVDPQKTPQATGNQFLASWKEIFVSDLFRYSVVCAAVSNVVVLSIPYLSVLEITSSADNTAQTFPFIAAGAGAMLAPPVKGYLTKLDEKRSLSLAVYASLTLLASTFWIGGLLTLLLCNLIAGFLGASVTLIAWNVRLKLSSKENIGTIAGLTGALYKLPSIVLLPLVGALSTYVGSPFACFALAGLLATSLFVLGKSPFRHPNIHVD